jgi:CBS domain-containing protein
VADAHGPVAVSSALAWLGVINMGLAVFNLIPGFPLDGGRVLRAAVWRVTHDLRKATRWASYGGKAFAMVLMGIGISRLLGGNWFGGLWLGFLGWLLFQAAQGSYTQVKLKQALGAVHVADLMSRGVETLEPTMTLREAVEQHFMVHSFGGYPVVDPVGHPLGMLTRLQVKAVPADQWDAVMVGEAMVPVDRLPVLRPQDAVGDRLETLLGDGLGRLPVVEDGRVVGLLSQTDVIRYLTWHGEAKGEDLLG